VPAFFHVHAGQGLPVGGELTLRSYDAPTAELRYHLAQLFPNGLTEHGGTYLGLNPARIEDVKTNGWRESIFEFVRRSAAPDRPSRFTTIFASASIEEARIFRRSKRNGIGTIYELDAAESFHTNMALLDESASYLAVSEAAHAYWRGDQGTWPPLWEELIVPPARVVGIVPD
jgi:Protein of unknown function (DUF2441)